MDNKNYYAVGTVPKYNRNVKEKGRIDSRSTSIHDRLPAWIGTGSLISSGRAKLVLRAQSKYYQKILQQTLITICTYIKFSIINRIF
jgi:hypothetical protein